MERWEQAVDAVRRRARADEVGAVARAERVLGADVELTRSGLADVGRLTVNFHPDRVGSTGRTVAAGLLHDGRYRSQWVTWISNGGRSAIVGGERHGWERQLFAGTYDGADPTSVEFPIYGAWDVLTDPHGGSPRFGSSYLVLAAHVADRTTVCVGDSHVGPADVGTFDELSSILAGLAEQAVDGGLMGRPLGVADLRRVLAGERVVDAPARELDHYVEAQVHGGVDLGVDVQTVVVDPSFRNTSVHDDLARAADRFGFELRWHGGSLLAVADVPDDFRGPTMPAVAARVADGAPDIDAAMIGRAARALRLGPPLADGDDPASEAQQLKYLWHTLARFGRDTE